MPYPIVPYNPGDFDLDVATDLIIEIGDAVGAASTVPVTYPVPEGVPGWTVKPVTRHGVSLGATPNAFPTSITKTLNFEDEFEITSPKYDETTLLFAPHGEAQIYRYGHLKAWGILVGDNASSSDGAVTFPGRGLWWIFKRRYFGTAKRSNMITNGDFELGVANAIPTAPIPGWTAFGSVITGHYTAATKWPGRGLPDPRTGTKAIVLHSSLPGQNNYIRTRWSYRTDWPPGQLLTFAAAVYIADDYSGPAAMALGLLVRRIVAGKIESQDYVALDDSTPVGEWVRLETTLRVKPHRDGYLEVLLFSPGGYVAWDSAIAVRMESTSSAFAGTDQATLAGMIVRYGQHGRGKQSVNVGTSTPATGVLRKRAWQHADHDWLADSVDELGAFTNGFDHDVVVTPSTRTFRTYYPRKGTDRSAHLTLKTGSVRDGGNLATYSRGRDGSSSSDSIIARAAGDGPGREEGAAHDLTLLDGLLLEDVVDAPEDLPVDELDDFAADELDTMGQLIEVLEVTTHEGHGRLIDVLETGDLVHVLIDDGYVQVDAVYRIVKIVITCATDSATLTLNRWDA